MSAPGAGEAPRSVAVLGADGFIGNALVRAALAAGLEVTALTLKQPWRLEGVSSASLERVAIPGGKWWLGDPAPELVKALARADVLALLAYTPPAADDDEKLAHEREINVAGTRVVAELAEASSARVVFTSSADVYGTWLDDPISESAEPRPSRPYAVAKLEAEAGIRRASPGATIMRVSTVFGPGENGPRAIPSFIRAFARGEPATIHGDGTDVHDYIYVDDVAGGLLSAIAKDPSAPVYNLGSGIPRTTIEVARAVAKAMGRPVGVRHVESERPPARLVLDCSSIASDLGFRPSMAFEAGLQAEVDWLLRRLQGL